MKVFSVAASRQYCERHRERRDDSERRHRRHRSELSPEFREFTSLQLNPGLLTA